MGKKKIISVIALFVLGIMVFTSCKTIQDIQSSLTNIRNLQFRLKSIDNFKLAGIGVANKNSVSDFSITDGLKLTQAFSSNRFPAEFVLNVEAKNPNDGTGTNKSTALTLERLQWTLFIDNVQTIQGDITNRIEVPGKGGSTIIPIFINLDLYEFFGNRGYEGIIKLALTLGGVKGNTSSIRMNALPLIRTPLGLMEMPEVTIVDHKFTS
jgi:predicted small secreted protein